MIYYINPTPKPRMTQRDRWKKRPCVERYFAFKDQVRAEKIKLTYDSDKITFFISMPKSWNKKKRRKMNGTPHQQRPDLDNLLKALWDAVFEEDSRVWNISASKLWAEEGKIIVW